MNSNTNKSLSKKILINKPFLELFMEEVYCIYQMKVGFRNGNTMKWVYQYFKENVTI